MNRGQAADAILRCTLTGPEKLILLGYLSHAPSADRANGKAWPGITTLSHYASQGMTATRQARKRLVDRGVLVVVAARAGCAPTCRIDFEALPSDPSRFRMGGDPSRFRTPPDSGPLQIPDDPPPDSGWVVTPPDSGPLQIPDDPPPDSGWVPLRIPDPNPPNRTLLIEPSPFSVEQPDPSPTSTPPAPRTDWLEVWGQLQAVRAEHTPHARSQGLTQPRKANLIRRCGELTQAGLTRADLLRAAAWVHESGNVHAEGARATGDPLATLLRPAHCVQYCELARDEEGHGPPPMRTRGPHTETSQERQARRDREVSIRLGMDPDDEEYNGPSTSGKGGGGSSLVALAGGAP